MSGVRTPQMWVHLCAPTWVRCGQPRCLHVAEGIRLIRKQFDEFLKKLGVEEIEALGLEFDPNFHNAVMHTEDENFGENTICQVFQKGFKIGEKIVRFAMVQVAN